MSVGARDIRSLAFAPDGKSFATASFDGAVGLWEPASLAFAQISGTVMDAQLGTGINANKIGGGAVGNTARHGYSIGIQAGVASFRPTMPAMIKATLTSRAALAGSPSKMMPRITVPTAPTPTQTP